MPHYTRRRAFLSGATAGVSIALAGCLGGGGGATETPTDVVPKSKYGGWFSDTSNFKRTIDMTERDSVTVMVGAEGNGGNLAFDPPAILISPDTTVVWEWTGEGGEHSVTHFNGRWTSETTAEAGHTFERTFTQYNTTSAIIRYQCTPHGDQGMRGAIARE